MCGMCGRIAEYTIFHIGLVFPSTNSSISIFIVVITSTIVIIFIIAGHLLKNIALTLSPSLPPP